MFIQILVGLFTIGLFLYVVEMLMPEWFRRFLAHHSSMLYGIAVSFFLVLLFLFGINMLFGFLLYFGFIGFYIPWFSYNNGEELLLEGEGIKRLVAAMARAGRWALKTLRNYQAKIKTKKTKGVEVLDVD